MSSSLVSVTKYGSVVQLVRILACHASGHGFESRQSRLWHLPLTGQESRLRKQESDEQRSQVRLLPAFQPENVGSIPAGVINASVAQLVERMPEEHGVAGSTPARGTNISVSFNGRTPVFEAVNGSSILSTEIMGVSHSGNCT